jgi:hypothetical protein
MVTTAKVREVDKALQGLDAEEKIAALVCSLVERGEGVAGATVCSLMGCVEYMAHSMSQADRYRTADVARQLAADVERIPAPLLS